MTDAGREFDVGLSFAGEDRDYVEQVALLLREAGIKVFYDDFDVTGLWGRDLATHLDGVYRTSSRYVVPFISRHYAEKAFPQHEFRSALARAVEAREPYILPVRFDDIDLPGLAPTIAYLDARRLSPAEIADHILRKLGRGPAKGGDVASTLRTRVPRLVPGDFNPYAEAERTIETLRTRLTGLANGLREQGYGIHTKMRDGRFILRVMNAGRTLYGLDVWIGTDFGENTISFRVGAGGDSSPNSSNAFGAIEWDRDRGVPTVRLTNLSLLDEMGGEYRLSAEELADAIWEEAIRRLDQLAE